jgi:FKBP-type peptidyl-prolyl cis-trans isomerase SlyD
MSDDSDEPAEESAESDATAADEVEHDHDHDHDHDHGHDDDHDHDHDHDHGVDEDVDDEGDGGIQDGDFVRLEYTVRTIEDGTVIDTTREDVADEAGIDDDQYEFEPRVIVVGAGHVFQRVDEALIGAHPGDEGTIEIPAEEAFGEPDPDDVRTISAEKIDEDDRYPGAQVTIDGEQGRVETIVGGRARVNFNHPLAGEDLEYEYELLGVVEDRVERAQGLLGMYLQQVPEMYIQVDEVEEERTVEVDDDGDEEAADTDTDADTDEDGDEAADTPGPELETIVETVEKESLYIEATPQMTMNQQWLFSKRQIAQDLMQRLDLDRVVVQEIIDGGGMGMGMGGMMGGMGGAPAPAPGGDADDVEDVDVDPEEIVEGLETE